MTRQDAEVLMLRAEVERLRGQVAHWRAARESAIAGGDILKAEVERLRAENDALRNGSLLRPPAVSSPPFTDKQIAAGAAKLAALKHPPTRTRWWRCDEHAWLAQEPCHVCIAAARAALGADHAD